MCLKHRSASIWDEKDTASGPLGLALRPNQQMETNMADKNVPVQQGTRGGSLLGLRDEIDSLFNSFLRGGPLAAHRFFDLDPFRRPGGEGASLPSVDVAETENAYVITADMPGMDEKDIELSLSEDVLTIKGEKKEEREEKKKDYHLVERRYGAFNRSFRLPDGVDGEKIEASCDKGVLTVTLPKKAEKKAETKKIEVRKK